GAGRRNGRTAAHSARAPIVAAVAASTTTVATGTPQRTRAPGSRTREGSAAPEQVSPATRATIPSSAPTATAAGGTRKVCGWVGTLLSVGRRDGRSPPVRRRTLGGTVRRGWHTPPGPTRGTRADTRAGGRARNGER